MNTFYHNYTAVADTWILHLNSNYTLLFAWPLMSSSEYCTQMAPAQMNATALWLDILHWVHAELQYQIQEGFIDATHRIATQATHYTG